MAVTLNANTSTGFIATSDTSGILQLQTAGTTALAVSAAQVVTLTNPLPVASGGSGGTTSTGTGANVLGTTPSFTSTIGVGGATPSASGAGITFPATQSASSDANTLDDYEEGAWTPSLSYVTPGTASFTYSTQSGAYVKVGNIVTIRFMVRLTAFSKGTASGEMLITGLPFAGAGELSGAVIGTYDSPYTNANCLYALVDAGTATMPVRGLASNAVLPSQDPDSNSQYFGSLTYFV